MQRVSLESFEATEVQQSGADGGFEQGFVEGHAAGIAAAHSEQSVLRKELVQSIADIEFKYNEARGEIIASLAPLFDGLVEKVFPRLVQDHFAAQIVATLAHVAEQAVVKKLQLRINPSQRDAILSAVSETGIELTFEDDESLSETSALIGSDRQEILIDFENLIHEIGTVLSTVQSYDQRTQTYG